jgi:hypothetical protein
MDMSYGDFPALLVEGEDVTFNAIFDAQAGISVEKSTFRTRLDSFLT